MKAEMGMGKGSKGRRFKAEEEEGLRLRFILIIFYIPGFQI